jgi:hypothetical protein
MSRQDRASATTFSVSFLGDTQMLLHILQGVKASIYAKRGLNLLSHRRYYSYDL